MPGYPRSNDADARRFRPRRRSTAYTLLELMIVLAIITTIAGLSWPALMRPWSRSLAQQAAQQLARELIHTRTAAIEQSRIYEMRWEEGGRAFEIRPVDGEWPSTRELVDPTMALDDMQSSSDEGSSSRESRTRSGSRLAESALQHDPRASLGTSDATADRLATGVPANQDHGGRLVSDELPAGVHFPGAPPDRPREGEQNDDLGALDSTGLQNQLASAETPVESENPSQDPLSADEATINLSAKKWSQPVRFYPDGRSASAKWMLASDDGYEVEVTLRGLTGLASVGRVRTVWTPPELGSELDAEEETPGDREVERADSSLPAPATDRASSRGDVTNRSSAQSQAAP